MNTELSNKSKDRILYLDVARVVAIISISLNHAVNRSYDNYTNPQLEFFTSSLLENAFKAFVTVFSRIGVPLFLMITGVLILNKTMEKESDFKRFYKHNFLNMFITTELWFFIMFWINVIWSTESPYNEILHVQGLKTTIISLIDTLTFQNQVSFGSMWYMPMILAIYLTLPILCVAVKKMPKWAIYIPMGAMILNIFVLNNFNSLMSILGRPQHYSAVEDAYVFSAYHVYILFGYFIGKGMLKKLKTWLVSLIAIGSFVINGLAQLYLYSLPECILISYRSLGTLICAVFLFELLRRIQDRFKCCEKAVCYISREAFAIYFIHIIIMSFMCWYLPFNLPRAVMLFVYEVVSVGGSMLIIGILKKSKFCKKYLLSIK